MVGLPFQGKPCSQSLFYFICDRHAGLAKKVQDQNMRKEIFACAKKMPKCVYFYKYVFILSNMYAFIFYKKNYVFTNMFVWFDQYVLIFTNSLFFLKYVKSFTNIILMFTNLCVFLCSRVCNTRTHIEN